MRSVLLALIISTTAFACTTTPSDVITATGSAVGSAIAAAPTGSGEVAAKPAEEAIRPNHAADDKATADLQARGEADMKATAAQEALDVEAAKVHGVATDRFQANFDASDRKFNVMKEKAKKVPAATKKTADVVIADIAAREATVMSGIKRLRSATGPAWDTAKAQVEIDSAALDKSIDAFGATLN
jgi:hypothetical protein